MPRGKGHQQRQAAEFKEFANARFMLQMRASLWDDEPEVPEHLHAQFNIERHTADPYDQVFQENVNNYLEKKIRRKAASEPIVRTENLEQLQEDLCCDTVAADLYYHDFCYAAATASIVEDHYDEIDVTDPTLALTTEEFSVCVIDPQHNIKHTLVPSILKENEIKNEFGIIFDGHASNWNVTSQNVSDLREQISNIQPCEQLDCMPPELIEEIGKYLSCRDKLTIMIRQPNIRFRPCTKRDYEMGIRGSDDRDWRYPQNSLNRLDCTCSCRRACYCKYYKDRIAQATCICQSALWFRPYLFLENRFRWALNHCVNRTINTLRPNTPVILLRHLGKQSAHGDSGG